MSQSDDERSESDDTHGLFTAVREYAAMLAVVLPERA